MNEIRLVMNNSNIIIVGFSQGGKSTITEWIYNNFNNPSDYSKPNLMDFGYSTHIINASNKNKYISVKIFDTHGFDETHKISPDLFNHLSKFLQEINNGINILLFVIPIIEQRLNIDSFRRILSIFGRKIAESKNMIIVYTQGSRLVDRDRIKAIEKYKKELGIILSENSIRINYVKQLDFDLDKELLKNIIKQDIEPFIPDISTSIKSVKTNNPYINDEHALFKAAESNYEMSAFIDSIIQNAQNIVEDSKAYYRLDSTNLEAKMDLEDKQEKLAQLTKNWNDRSKIVPEKKKGFIDCLLLPFRCCFPKYFRKNKID